MVFADRDDAGRRLAARLGHRWGRMDVEGIGAGKDFKLYPGGGREWDWNETGPGTGLASGPETLKGMFP